MLKLTKFQVFVICCIFLVINVGTGVIGHGIGYRDGHNDSVKEIRTEVYDLCLEDCSNQLATSVKRCDKGIEDIHGIYGTLFKELDGTCDHNMEIMLTHLDKCTKETMDCKEELKVCKE